MYRERDHLRTEVEKLQGQVAGVDLKEKMGLEELDKLTKEVGPVKQWRVCG